MKKSKVLSYINSTDPVTINHPQPQLIILGLDDDKKIEYKTKFTLSIHKNLNNILIPLFLFGTCFLSEFEMIKQKQMVKWWELTKKY